MILIKNPTQPDPTVFRNAKSDDSSALPIGIDTYGTCLFDADSSEIRGGIRVRKKLHSRFNCTQRVTKDYFAPMRGQ
jgi:hypothetical protein